MNPELELVLANCREDVTVEKVHESISSDIILKVTVKIFNTSAGFKEAQLMK
jgi:hypothetical protein